MKQVLIGAAILGGAYFLLKDNIAQFMAPPAAATPPQITPPAEVPTTANLPAIKAAIKAKITAAGSASILTALQVPDTWNWWGMQTYPVWKAPAPEQLFSNKANPRDPVSFEDWFAAVSPTFPATGLAGVRSSNAAPSQGKRRPGRQAWT